MSGFTYADPIDFDMTAATGSYTFNAPNPAGPSTAPWVYHDSANTSTTYFPFPAALDGDANTAWETGGLVVGSTWYAIAAGNGNPITMSSYQMKARSGWGGRMPSNWTIEGSDDGVAWTVVDSRSGITNWGADAVTFAPATPSTHLYFRINVSAIWADGIVNLGEFYLNNTPNPVSSGAAQPVFFYVRMRNLPECREYHPMVTPGTTTIVDEYSAWMAWIEAYPENSGDYAGYYQRFSPSNSYIDAFGTFHGGGIIVRFKLAGYGTFTWTWTSTDYAQRPFSWFNAKPLTGANGVEHYTDWDDALGYRLFYTMTPTTTDLITITANQPDNYFEVYRETGQTSYDDYIEDGYNLYHGAPTPDPDGGECAFQPVVGQTYVIVVYGNSPDPANPPYWELTWTTTHLEPPPYVITNDELATAKAVQISGDTGSFGYDNTGATQGVQDGDPRSIWYSFSVSQARYLYFKATPGDAAAGAPRLAVWNTDGSYASVSQSTPAVGDLVMKGVPGTTYVMEMYWPDSNPGTPWDSTGSCGWKFYDIPNDAPETAQPLAIGGGGDPAVPDPQNVAANGPIPEFRGAGLWFRIVMPMDGALCVVIEVPDAEIAAHANFYNYFNGALYKDGPGNDIYGTFYPLRVLSGTIPARGVSQTTVLPLMRAAKAGDVFLAYVMAPVEGALLRWGVATDPEWGVWHSTDWSLGNSFSSPTPSAIRDWPTGAGAFYGAADGVSWSASDSQDLPESGVWPLLEGDRFPGLLDSVQYGKNIVGPVIRGYEAYGPSQSWHAGGLVDPNHDREQWDVSVSTQISGERVGIWGTADPDPLAINAYRYQIGDRNDPYGRENFQPVDAPATRGLYMQFPDLASNFGWTGDLINEIGKWAFEQGQTPQSFQYWYPLEKRQFAIEWSADNPNNDPQFDLFRSSFASWHKGVHGAGIGAPGYAPAGFGFQAKLVSRVNDIPSLGGSNPSAWPLPALGGVVIDSFTSTPDEVYDGVYAPYGDERPDKYNNWDGLRDHYKILTDVTNRQWPEITWSHTEVWGAQLDNVPAELPVTNMAQRLAEVGPEQGNLFGIGWWPSGDFSVSWRVQLMMGRKYPDQYRVGRYTPSLAPIVLPGTQPDPQQTPGAGYYVFPNPNLDGESGGVDVHFASAT